VFHVNRVSRAVLAGAAFAAFAGSFVTTPFDARGAAGVAIHDAASPAASPTPAEFAAVLPRRDPFAGDPPARHHESAMPFAAPPMPFAAAPPAVAAMAIPAALAPLPPNPGALGTPLSTAGVAPGSLAVGSPAPSLQVSGSVRVTAVITGTHPYALLDDAQTARLVTIGDRVGNDEVAAITADGVRFADGRTLRLSPESPATRPQLGGHAP
jgi:hypothetical protein